MVDYMVEYDFDAIHDDELSIQVGETIRNVRNLQEEGRLEGELMGEEGGSLIILLRKLSKRRNPRITICPSNGKGMEM